MVRQTPLLSLLALAWTASLTSAQTQAVQVDWQNAGGDLFAPTGTPTPAPTPEPTPAPPPAMAVFPTLDGPSPGLIVPRLDTLHQPYAGAIAEAAARHGLDPKLLHALVVVESGYLASACSPAGACGLTQLMPATARELGVGDRMEPVQNLHGGADYLARQLLRFGDIRLALAAYNAGPGRVARLGRIPEIAETQAYVVAVVDCYLTLSAGRGVRSSRDCSRGDAR